MRVSRFATRVEVFQRPDPYRQVKPFFEEIDAPVAQVEIEAYLWVGL